MKENDLVYEDFENQPKVKWFPEAKSSKDYDQSDRTIADLLSWSKTFNESLIKARGTIKIDKLEYPKESTIKSVASLTFALDESKRKFLDNETEKIRLRFKLTEAWSIPIETAILTNTILIPPKESIQVHLPTYFIENEKESLASLSQRLNVLKYPALYFTRRVEVNELKTWINANRRLIRAIQFRLPKKKVFRRSKKTLFWGQVAWILRQDGITSWSKMRDRIQELVNKIPENELDPADFTQTVPESSDLEKHYNRFLESLADLQK